MWGELAISVPFRGNSIHPEIGLEQVPAIVVANFPLATRDGQPQSGSSLSFIRQYRLCTTLPEHSVQPVSFMTRLAPGKLSATCAHSAFSSILKFRAPGSTSVMYAC